MSRPRILVLIGLLILLLAAVVVVNTGKADAQQAPCKADTVVAIGGVNDPDAGVYKAGTADVRVKYSAQFGAVDEGVAAFDKAVKTVRAACPGTHVIAAGFSQGAQVVHVWLQRSTAVPNKVGVLFSDPKQINSGLAFYERDNKFGGTTTVSICNDTDVICNLKVSNIRGYPVEHLKYNFDARVYAGRSGIVWE